MGASDLDDAPTFFDLYEFIQSNFDCSIPWVSYGNLTELSLKSQCEQLNLKFPFSNRFINLRNLFGLLNGSEFSMNELLSELNIFASSKTCEDDIYNCAILLKILLSKVKFINV